ncbi:MAG: secretin N-terminal domain-containing protein [Deltaproteobacteria bacterium]
MKTQNSLFRRVVAMTLTPFFLAGGIAGPAPLWAQDAAASSTPSPAAGATDTGVEGSSSMIADAEPGRISLDLKGIDIIELLKIMSLKMGVNIVPTKEVTGRVNIFLNNVTLEDAFDIILINNSLAAVKEGDIITVMTTERYNQLYGKRYTDERKIRMYHLKNASPQDVLNILSQLKSDVGKIIIDEKSGTVILMDVPASLDLLEKALNNLEEARRTEVFTLNYAKADEMQGKIASILTPGSSEVQIDTRTNKMAITDLPEKLKKIKEVIKAFDEEDKQVQIEAQIVQIALNDRTAVGVDWEKIFAYHVLNPITMKGTFPLSGVQEAGQFSVGTLEKNDFDLVIDILNSITKTNVLSRPRITVVNNQEASILIGSKEVYFSQTQSQSSVTTTTAESVNFVDVGVKINVTPTITDDGFVIMKIRPEVSSVRETATSPLGSSVPVVETAQAETTVKVRDNVMVMIAGLMKEEVRDTRTKYPWVSDLPLIGWLFGSKNKQKVKSELAIFLTPHITRGDEERVDAAKEQIKTYGILTKQPKGAIE